ncbi:glutathione S-transferase family protein [Peristeroidobacter soli]|uniref:glutathione S-transferase family protein n=1 Tax=Peristeroidobacter soli TaxID=2497877 RepID=UPI00101C401C|nr:glutathione S-transferase [Peristeroidobacter soli]
MKLHWSPKSPFVRKVMIAAHECGVADRIERVRNVAAMTRPNAAIMADNPLSKVPTLKLDNGVVLYDSTVICEYLDSLATRDERQQPLFPADGAARWEALRRNALGSGLLDILTLWRNERERSHPSHELLAAFDTKTRACLEQMATDLTAASAHRFDIGDIAMGCALAYLDFRFEDLDWRASQPLLATWFARFSQRPSVLATRIVDDSPSNLRAQLP